MTFGGKDSELAELMKINADDPSSLVYDGDMVASGDHTFEVVKRIPHVPGRWMRQIDVVVRSGHGRFWMFPYHDGLTENQESELPNFSISPPAEVEPYEVTSISYRKKVGLLKEPDQ